MRGFGRKASASFSTRFHVAPSFWLRRRSTRRHRRVMWRRNAASARKFVGTAWYVKKPVTTCRSQLPCCGMGWCIRCRSSALTSLSLAVMRSRRVFRLSRKLPRRDLPQMKVKPKKLKVSGLPSPRCLRVVAAWRPNSIRRVLLRMQR